jgi:hypothetical protein
VFLFKEHTRTLCSRNISRNEHIVSNGSIPLSSYEIASNDPHGEEYIEPSLIFCVDDYRKININHDYKNHIMCGWSSFRAYLNALTYLLDHQKTRGHNSLPYGCLRKNGEIKKLMDLVKTRHVSLAKSDFDESLKNASMRFQIVDKIPDIKEGFWKRNGIKKNFHCASLRDRYFYLFTVTGIVRGESPIRAELSDIFSIVKEDEGPPGHDAVILIMQILEGKTNNGKIVWGRTMRHKNVSMCSIGALGFYLMSRFEVTGEIFDFETNKSWFNRKLLVSPTHAKTLDKEMSFQHYPIVLKQIFSGLGIVIEKYFHFGRFYGNMDGELNGDLSSAELENLGNWLMTQREECYSTKLPLRPMRVMAKHPERKGGYFYA